MIDLDQNATTQPSPAVVDAMVRGLTQAWANPSSVHRAGQAARHAVELARTALAALINAKPREIVLTSGGTESLHLALRGTLEALGTTANRPLLATTRTEHSAVRELAEELERSGRIEVAWLPTDARGVLDLAALAETCRRRPWLVAVQWANNETGVVQPVDAISAAARSAGTLFLCDATQWVGKMPVASPAFADLLTFSPHKFHGPKGVGVLWLRQGVRLRPQSPGSQELGRRAGTENVAGIIGAGVAAEEAAAWLADPSGREAGRSLRDRFEAAVLAGLPGAVVNGAGAERLWNTSNIGFPRLEAEALLMSLSERGIFASAGAACSSGSLDPSPVLLAMGIPPEVAHGSLRFSLGRRTTAAEVDSAAQAVIEVVRRHDSALAGLSAAPRTTLGVHDERHGT